MATVRLNGDASGYVELKAPNAAGSNSLILPNGNGSASQYLQTDGAGSLVWADPFRLVQSTAKDWNWNGLTTNTSIDFTGIPSWAKRVTVMFDGVSTSGTSNLLIQLGDSGGIETTGYTSGADNSGGSGITTATAGFILTQQSAAANVAYGSAYISTMSANTWIYTSSLYTTLPRIQMGGGTKTLSGTLDRVRITTVNGTDTFDAGSINIMWEG